MLVGVCACVFSFRYVTAELFVLGCTTPTPLHSHTLSLHYRITWSGFVDLCSTVSVKERPTLRQCKGWPLRFCNPFKRPCDRANLRPGSYGYGFAPHRCLVPLDCQWSDPHASCVTWRRNGPWLPSAQECLWLELSNFLVRSAEKDTVQSEKPFATMCHVAGADGQLGGHARPTCCSSSLGRIH